MMYYQELYKFVDVMKSEFEKRKPQVDWEAIERRKEKMRGYKDDLTARSKMQIKEKIDAGKKKMDRMRRRTIHKLKKLEPEENYRLKLTFTKSVMTLVLKTWAVCAGQWLLPWYYSITCPALIIWRVYSYWQHQWQYFCLDFCYFGNTIIAIILWLFPGSPEMFAVQFSLAHGMLYLGAFSFYNSLVFHSVDKMTSTYIHTVPVLLTFGIRWFPLEASRYWHSDFPTEFIPACLKWNVWAPFAILMAHTVFYYVLVYMILKPEEHIVTSFRYLKGKASTKAIFGPNPPYAVFVGMNIILCLTFSTLTMITYSSFYANVFAILLLFAFVTWNGAGYYVDIFRMSMVRRLEREKSNATKED